MIKKILMYTIALVLFGTALGETCSIDNKPDWLQSTLCLTTVCSDEPESSYRRAVSFFDFNDKTISSLEIPTDGYMVLDHCNDVPVIISFNSNSYEESGYSPWKWRRFSALQVLKDSNSYYLSSFEDSKESSDKYPFGKFIAYADFFASAPIAILGVSNSDLGGVYYLEYAANNGSSLEIHLKYIDRMREYIYTYFPIDYNFGSWDYSISDSGKIAWYSEREKVLTISDGHSNRYELEIENLVTLCWIDDNQLLFIMKNQNTTNYDFFILDFTSRIVQPFYTQEKYLSTDITPYTISIDNTNTLLALYGQKAGNPQSIEIYNLQTGEKYRFYPFPNQTSSSVQYNVSDDGLFLIEHGEDHELKLAWYPK